jgi:hypothetical protein
MDFFRSNVSSKFLERSAREDASASLFDELMAGTSLHDSYAQQNHRHMYLAGRIDSTGMGGSIESGGPGKSSMTVVKAALSESIKENMDLKARLKKTETLLRAAKGRIMEMDGVFDSNESFNSILDEMDKRSLIDTRSEVILSALFACIYIYIYI